MDPTAKPTSITDTAAPRRPGTPATPGAAAPDEAAAFAEATRRYAAGDPHGALGLVRPLVDAHPESLSARLLVARCAARLGAPAVALATAEEAAACDPTSWEAQVLVAQAATGIDLDRALEAADRAVALAPDQPATMDARTQVVAARAANEATAKPGGARGSLGAALGGARRATTATPRATPSAAGLTAPVVSTALALDPTPIPEARPAERPLRLPKALAGVAPEGMPVLDAPTADAALAVEATGPAGAGLDVDPTPDGETDSSSGAEAWASPGRTVLVVLGSLTWLFVGFRYGAQVIGGPVGYALFVAVAAFVAFYWRTRLRPGPGTTTGIGRSA